MRKTLNTLSFGCQGNVCVKTVSKGEKKEEICQLYCPREILSVEILKEIGPIWLGVKNLNPATNENKKEAGQLYCPGEFWLWKY